jgi:sporulation protein YlmC with PRC-barrel domain
MNRSLKEVVGYSIEAIDGAKGKVKDFLFDEESLTIRYLEADLGAVFSGREVLIPQMFLQEPDWPNQRFLVELNKLEIEGCPELSKDLPISRKYEQELHKHYKVEDYWSRTYTPPIGAPVITHVGRTWGGHSKVWVPSTVIHEDDINSSLRSFNEIKGYHIQASDGTLGHIEDIIIDDQDWQIVYVIVDTSNWLPWSKKVLIGTSRMDEISYVNQQVKINLSIESIKSAPEFDPSKPVNVEYEKQLYDYYGRPVNK